MMLKANARERRRRVGRWQEIERNDDGLRSPNLFCVWSPAEKCSWKERAVPLLSVAECVLNLAFGPFSRRERKHYREKVMIELVAINWKGDD